MFNNFSSGRHFIQRSILRIWIRLLERYRSEFKGENGKLAGSVKARADSGKEAVDENPGKPSKTALRPQSSLCSPRPIKLSAVQELPGNILGAMHHRTGILHSTDARCARGPLYDETWDMIEDIPTSFLGACLVWIPSWISIYYSLNLDPPVRIRTPMCITSESDGKNVIQTTTYPGTWRLYEERARTSIIAHVACRKNESTSLTSPRTAASKNKPTDRRDQSFHGQWVWASHRCKPL